MLLSFLQQCLKLVDNDRIEERFTFFSRKLLHGTIIE